MILTDNNNECECNIIVKTVVFCKTGRYAWQEMHWKESREKKAICGRCKNVKTDGEHRGISDAE